MSALNYEPMYGSESDKLKKDISRLISGYNCFCDMFKKFNTGVPKEFFEKAREEVLDSGNASLSVMLCIAIEEMGNVIQELRENNKELESDLEFQSETEQSKRLRELEKEVKQLRYRIQKKDSVIEKVSKALNSHV